MELAPAKLLNFNIDDQVIRNLSEAKTSARRAEYMVTVANAFFASRTDEAHKDVVDTLVTAVIINTMCLL